MMGWWIVGHVQVPMAKTNNPSRKVFQVTAINKFATFMPNFCRYALENMLAIKYNM